MTRIGTKVFEHLNQWRTTWLAALNAGVMTLSYTAALYLQQGVFAYRAGLHAWWLPLAMLCASRICAYAALGLNTRFWRYASAREAAEILKAHVLSSLVFALSIPLLGYGWWPLSFVLLELCISLLLALGTRLAVRLVYEYRCETIKAARGRREVVVFGAGPVGHLIVKTLQSPQLNSPEVVAVFDDDPANQKMTVHGVKVAGGFADLKAYLREHPHISTAHAAVADLPASTLQLIRPICEEFNVELKCVPVAKDSGAEILDLQSGTVEELLKRNTRCDHKRELGAALKGKKVLVTGAGGSIGSELVRQLLQYDPADLVLLDKCEYNLYTIEQELKKNFQGKQSRITYQLGNIVNEERLRKIIAGCRPNFIFHAAAYKHVPLLEQNCYEAFLNNVVGTRNLLAAARENHVERFVFVSTDKAVEPSSVMGCTKRICELMVQQANERNASLVPPEPGHYRLETAAVRFGNVINSAGSVIPLFKKQILAGEPITITHEKVERYFMSIPEAANLILVAGLLGRNGEIYMLDMGKPLRILDVAKKLRAFYGRRDLPVRIVGLRPGEKLSEELYYSEHEKREKTKFDKIFSVHSDRQAAREVFTWVRLVTQRLNGLQDHEVAALLQDFLGRQKGDRKRVWTPPEAEKWPPPGHAETGRPEPPVTYN